MPKGKEYPPQVREIVADMVSKDQKVTGKELKDAVESQVPGVELTVRTYQSLKLECIPIVDGIKASGLDDPWNIGLASKYTFLTPKQIFWITEIQRTTKISSLNKNDVSLRWALWIARLSEYPKFLVNKLYEGQADKEAKKRHVTKGRYLSDKWWDCLEEISRAYAYFELRWQLSGKPLPADTSELDSQMIAGNLVRVANDIDTGKNIIFTENGHSDLKIIVSYDKEDGE